jgi:hypothetical protein
LVEENKVFRLKRSNQDWQGVFRVAEVVETKEVGVQGKFVNILML